MKLRESMQPAPRVLVVDDDLVDRKLVTKGLTSMEGLEVLEAEDAVAAQTILTREIVDVVVTDLLMPGIDGLALIRWARERCPDAVWIILSGIETFDAAVEAVQLGAFDFLQKPPNLKKLEVAVRNAIHQRQLTRQKKKLNRALENKVLQLEGLCRVLQEQAGQIQDDIARAETIQRALLPQDAPKLDGFTVHSLYRPGHLLGGDLYDVMAADDRHVIVYVADASGHGVSAAMLSVLFKQRLRAMDCGGREVIAPKVALEKVSRDLYESLTAPGVFVTAAYGVLDTVERKLRIVSAGHPPLQLARGNGEVTEIRCTGPALGLSEHVSLAEHEICLEPGDRLLFYTDGLTDQPAAQLLKRERVAELLAQKEDPAPQLLKKLFREATDGTGDERDDVTLLYLEARPGESSFDNVEDTIEEALSRPVKQPVAHIVSGESHGMGFLRIEGRGTYRQSDAFYEDATSRIEADQPLTVDLSACEYLDSTFLGILHAVVEHAEACGVHARLQGVRRSVRELLQELDMENVLEHVSQRMLPLPAELHPVSAGGEDSKPDYGKILWAHEILSSLSEKNQKKFRIVVETLRKELGED